ncbi:MAG: hypothetical protein LBT32_07235 [Peptococcaceae bacterium]|jgi:hypothetical protein|nr:hypothetical protein [Peptococcaceae bacterium]
MRWLFRIVVVALCLVGVKDIFFAKPPEFISWPVYAWQDRVDAEMKRWRESIQDLPASVEQRIKQLWPGDVARDHGERV